MLLTHRLLEFSFRRFLRLLLVACVLVGVPQIATAA